MLTITYTVTVVIPEGVDLTAERLLTEINGEVGYVVAQLDPEAALLVDVRATVQELGQLPVEVESDGTTLQEPR